MNKSQLYLLKLLKMKKFQFSLGIGSSGTTLNALRDKMFGNVRLIICGGAHMNPEISEEFHYLGITVLQGYGITECAPLVSVNRNRANKWNSVGLVSPHSEVKLVDGEIYVRGKNVMQGYYKQPEQTQEAFRDGWFCTGDLGEIDKDGFLYITGRKKNIIVLDNGKNIYPEEIEDKLNNLPYVQECVVVQREGKLYGLVYPDPELVKKNGISIKELNETMEQNRKLLNAQIPAYEQIAGIILRDEEFEKTPKRSIKRFLYADAEV